jgi:hypothetical protein
VAGKSKYGMNRIFKVLLDLLVVKFLGGYGNKPIYFFGGAGLWSFGIASFLWLAAIIERFIPRHDHLTGEIYYTHINRNPLFYVGILLYVMAMMLVMLGLVAEVNMRIYYESQRKPPYVVAETRNFD